MTKLTFRYAHGNHRRKQWVRTGLLVDGNGLHLIPPQFEELLPQNMVALEDRINLWAVTFVQINACEGDPAEVQNENWNKIKFDKSEKTWSTIRIMHSYGASMREGP